MLNFGWNSIVMLFWTNFALKIASSEIMGSLPNEISFPNARRIGRGNTQKTKSKEHTCFMRARVRLCVCVHVNYYYNSVLCARPL